MHTRKNYGIRYHLQVYMDLLRNYEIDYVNAVKLGTKKYYIGIKRFFYNISLWRFHFNLILQSSLLRYWLLVFFVQYSYFCN